MCATDFLKTSAEYSLGLDEDGDNEIVIPITDRWNFPMRPREMIGRSKQGEVRLTMANWGLIPHWAKSTTFGRTCYNARDDSLAAGKPAFREAFKRRRCLLLGSGFIEYADRLEGHPATEFGFADGSVFVYAGLFEVWGDEKLVSCTMITTEPNELIDPYHSRMPVILSRKDQAKWIDPTAHRDDLLSLLKPFPSKDMIVGPALLPGKNELHRAAKIID